MKNTAAFLTGIEKIEFGEVEVPKIKADEVLVKMEAIGVCCSDVHHYSHGRIGEFVVQFPFILGHECAGTIVETGKVEEHRWSLTVLVQIQHYARLWK